MPPKKAMREAEKRLQETERRLREELEDLRRRSKESERDLDEATAELSLEQDKVLGLEASLREARLGEERERSHADDTTRGGTDDPEVGSLIRGLEETRDDALEALDRAQWGKDKMERDHEYQLLKVRESMREELESKYKRDIQTRDELIELLKAKMSRVPSTSGIDEPTVSVINGREARGSGGGSCVSDTAEDPSRSNRLKLPTLPKFTGDDRDDVDSLKRWLAKLEKHAELQCWTEREKLVQFELHLAGRAERVYEILPSQVKENYVKATEALQERLNPVEREALVSAQLMRRKQQQNESVDEFAQDLEKLFERSYGRRKGMDESSKEMLKRDFFVQGLWLKWQEKVLPSAKTFHDALHQARAAEQQEKQLSSLHRSGFGAKLDSVVKPTPSVRSQRTPENLQKEPRVTKPDYSTRKGKVPGLCYECRGPGHHWRDCPERKAPSETPGRNRASQRATSSAVTSGETLEDRCQRLRQEWVDAEFALLSHAYEDKANVDQVAGAVGPLYYCTVNIAGEPVKAMVDTGSSATILSWDLFQALGRKANIPGSALYRPKVTLRDYSQRPILTGAMVDLEFEFHGKKVVVPVYLRAARHAGSEPCLLGTNVVFPLGLMCPGVGVEPSGGEDSPNLTAVVQLIHRQRVPSKNGTFLEARVEADLSTPLLFEPNQSWMASKGVEVEDAVVCPDADGRIWIPVSNCTTGTVELQPEVPIGSVVLLWEREGALCEEPETDLPVTPIESGCTASICCAHSVPDAQRKEELASILQIPKGNLTDEEAQRLIDCAVEFHDVFAVDDSERGEAQGVEHVIDTADSQPIRQIPRRVPFALRKEISRMVQEMLESEVIKESASPWASPVVLVKKKDGALRFCVDYRRLNAVTRKDTFPLPRIDDLLDQLQGKKIFTTLDAKRGYWQIRVQEASQEKTAFATFDGLYEFRVMPFGLCNAPATFQRLMQRALAGMSAFCSVYIDDILIFSESVEEHIEHLCQVFRRLRQVGLKLHPRKCFLGRPEVPYLGHVISAEGILPNPGKVLAVKEFPTPTNVRAVREFLGLASYYRRFVPGFAREAGPLHMLTRADVPFWWSGSCEGAFSRLKELLTSPPVLAYPDFSKPFVLHTDASGKGLGAVLEQEQTDGKNHPIAYASRTLSKHEQRYGITELETLAVVWSLRHFRAYLYGHKCTVYTDHSPVKSLLKTKHSSGKLARWGEVVAEFDLEVRYRPGRKNANADALSRSPISQSDLEDEEEVFRSVQVGAVLPVESSGELPLQENEELVKLQCQDAELGPVIALLEHEVLPVEDNIARRLTLEKGQYVVVDRLLYRIDNLRKDRLRLCVPKCMREGLLKEAHGGRFAGHFSPRGVYSMLSQRYWWDGMYKDVHAYCRSCLTCASYQGTGRRVKPPLMPIPVGGPFYRVGVDIMELPQTVNGNRYVISFVDYLTKWVESFPSDNQTSQTIVRLLVDHVICRHGVPEALISDRGPNLLSNLMKEVCEASGMQKLNTTAYHPQADGLVENFNRTLRGMLAKYAAKFGVNWDEHLHHLLFAYRTKPHESTGESPFFLLYGRDARIPCEATLSTPRTAYQIDLEDYKTELMDGLSTAWELARGQVQKAQRRQKCYYDRGAKYREFRVGDRVMVYMPYERTGKKRKLARPYFGPYRVIEVHSNGVSVRPVDRPKDKAIRVNLDRVTPCPKELPDVSWLGQKRARRN